MIFGLELITLEEGKNAGIRPLFGQNRRLGGGSYSRISLYFVPIFDRKVPYLTHF